MNPAAIFKLMRMRQWLKNAFVLAPLFFGSGLLNLTLLSRALAAFAIFCLVSSAVYIFNDWRDIEADRQHAKKRTRPLASGAVSVPSAFAILAVLLAVAGTIFVVSGLPPRFLIVIAAYLVINISYSLGLKQITLIELFMVASGFVLRLIAGALALNVVLSPWIVLATGLVSLLITTGKRRGDVVQENDVQQMRASLKGYNVTYLDSVLSALTGATLLVYLLFCVSDYAKARFGDYVILTALPVAVGLLRYLQLIQVQNSGDSPTDLLIRDKGMIITVIIFILMFSFLIYL